MTPNRIRIQCCLYDAENDCKISTPAYVLRFHYFTQVVNTGGGIHTPTTPAFSPSPPLPPPLQSRFPSRLAGASSDGATPTARLQHVPRPRAHNALDTFLVAHKRCQ